MKLVSSKVSVLPEEANSKAPPAFTVYQATLGHDNMGFFLSEIDAENSVLNFDPNAKRAQNFHFDLNPPYGEYSVVSRTVYCEAYPPIKRTR
jgi:hypothetical protein